MSEAGDSSLGDAVRLVVELQLGHDEVQLEHRLVDDLNADSFDLMNIVAVLEENHAVTITEEDAAAAVTVADLARLVESPGSAAT